MWCANWCRLLLCDLERCSCCSAGGRPRRGYYSETILWYALAKQLLFHLMGADRVRDCGEGTMAFGSMHAGRRAVQCPARVPGDRGGGHDAERDHVLRPHLRAGQGAAPGRAQSGPPPLAPAARQRPVLGCRSLPHRQVTDMDFMEASVSWTHRCEWCDFPNISS